MFDDLTRELKKIEHTTYEMPILADNDGYVDKECPNINCLKKFKVFAEDWNNINEINNTYCPFCGYKSAYNTWFTTEQITQAQEQAKQKMYSDISNAFSKGIKSANRKLNRNFNRKSFIKMNLSYKSNDHNFINLPAIALEEMQQKITCDTCGFRYAVIGSAFFCPRCGKNSAVQTFNNTIDKVKGNIKNIPTIYKTLLSIDKDEATRACDSLRINSLFDLVVAFQRLCECIYKEAMPNVKIRKNVFQRLDDGSKLFKEALGKEYNDLISDSEYKLLIKCFQKRHCFQHNEGIVDEDYLKKSGDLTYNLGQHLNITETEVIKYLTIVEKLGNGIIQLNENQKQTTQN